MTTEEVGVLFQSAVISGYVLPGLIFMLCAFGGAVVSSGWRRKRTTAVILGGFFAVAGLYLGDHYTFVPLTFFGLMVCCGLLTGLTRARARVQQPTRLRGLE